MGTGGGGSTTSEEKISVSVRVRPLNEAEKDLGCAWRPAEDAIVLDNSRKVRFFINDTATTEIYTRSIVGSVRCV